MSHVISVTVENKPGVLARVASMFARGISTSTRSPSDPHRIRPDRR